MKVKYAVNTLSASVANAINFLKDERLDDFKDSESTIKFIKIIDRLFDFLNSRNPFGKHFKQPLTIHNFFYLQAMVEKNIEYLFSLKCKNGTFENIKQENISLWYCNSCKICFICFSRIIIFI